MVTHAASLSLKPLCAVAPVLSVRVCAVLFLLSLCSLEAAWSRFIRILLVATQWDGIWPLVWTLTAAFLSCLHQPRTPRSRSCGLGGRSSRFTVTPFLFALAIIQAVMASPGFTPVAPQINPAPMAGPFLRHPLSEYPSMRFDGIDGLHVNAKPELSVRDFTREHRRALAGDGNTCSSRVTFPPPDSGSAFVLGSTYNIFYLMSAKETLDGHVYAAGHLLWYGIPYLTVTYFDPSLNVVWTQGILAGGAAAAQIYEFSEGVVTDDGSFVVTHFTNYVSSSAGGDVIIAQFASNGSLTWATVFGGQGNDVGRGVARDPSTGDLFVIGPAQLYFAPANATSNAFLAKLSPVGQLLWVTAIFLGPCYSVAVLDDSSVVIGGTGYNPYIALLDMNGNMLWAKQTMIPTVSSLFCGFFDVSPTGLIGMGGVVAPVTSDAGAYVMVLNATGEVQWSRTLPAPSADVILSSAWAPDGTLLACGQTYSQSAGGGEDGVCIRFSATGDHLGSFSVGGSAIDFFAGMMFPRAGGVLLLGMSSSYGAGYLNALVVRLDSYTEVPVSLGVVAVLNTTASNWTSANAITVTLPNPSYYAVPIQPLSGSYFSQSSLASAAAVPVAFTATQLTFPIVTSAFPVVPGALFEFEWSYQLPSTVYLGLSSPLSLTLHTNATWVSVVRNGDSVLLVGTPTLAAAGEYTVDLQFSATIPNIGTTFFPPITVSTCLSATPAGAMHAFTIDGQAAADLLDLTLTLKLPDGSRLSTGTVTFALTGAYTACIFRFSGFSDDSTWEWMFTLQRLTGVDFAGVHSAFKDVKVTLDASFVAVGYSDTPSAGGFDMAIAKVSSAGSLVWGFTIGGAGDDEATAVIVLSDDSAIVGGFSNSYGSGEYNGVLVKVSSSGSVLWSRVYGDAAQIVHISTLCVGEDGSLLAGGSISASTGGDTNILLFSFDGDNGAVMWSKLFGGSGNEAITSLIPSPFESGSFLLTGSTSSVGAGGLDVLIGAVNGSGVISWLSTLGGPGDDAGSGLAVGADDAIAVTGSVSSFGSVGFGGLDIMLAVFDEAGSLSWALDVGSSGTDYGSQVFIGVGEMFIAGSCYFFDLPYSALMRCSASGDLSPNFAGDSAFITTVLQSRAWSVGSTDVAGGMRSTAIIVSSQSVGSNTTSTVAAEKISSLVTVSPVEYFSILDLPPPVTQVPFAKPFHINIASATNPPYTVTSVGSTSLPSWLQLDRFGNVTGTPLNSVRGFYYLQVTGTASAGTASQNVTFVLNVTNTAPFYDGPLLFSAGLGNFQFSLREYVFDAEGDTVGDYVLAAYDGVLPSSIATLNIGTGQLEGAALSGSGGVYVYNVTMSDSFGAVGWAVIHLQIHEPSAVVALLQPLIPVLLSGAGVLAVLFALWKRDSATANAVLYVQQLAQKYQHMKPTPCNRQNLANAALSRKALGFELRLVDSDTFDAEALKSQVLVFCDQLLSLSSSHSESNVHPLEAVGVYKLIHNVSYTVLYRLQNAPLPASGTSLLPETFPKYHSTTLLLLNVMVQVMETVLLAFGSQLLRCDAPPPSSFYASLRRMVCAPWRCLSCCGTRSKRPQYATKQLNSPLTLNHLTRGRMLSDLRNVQSSLAGVFGIGMECRGLGCIGRPRMRFEVDMLHAMECLQQFIMYLPDSAAASDLLLNSFGHLLAPSILLGDLRDILTVPATWFSVYVSTRLGLQALSVMPVEQRSAELTSIQRNLYNICFLNKVGCSGSSVSVEWQLMYGLVMLFEDLLTGDPSVLRESDRQQIRGDGGMYIGLLTLALIRDQARFGVFAAQSRWVSQAAESALLLCVPRNADLNSMLSPSVSSSISANSPPAAADGYARSSDSKQLVLRGLFSAPSAMRLSANHNLHTVATVGFPVLMSPQRRSFLGQGRRVQDVPAPVFGELDDVEEEVVVMENTDHIV